MLRSLKTKNIGPMTEMELEFGAGLNVFTGDNGLGKSFLLDIIWFSLTKTWPREINPKLTQGYMVRPTGEESGRISVGYSAKEYENLYSDFIFDYESQAWSMLKDSQIVQDCIVVYAMPDGGFGVFDPYRKGNLKDIFIKYREQFRLSSPFVFSAQEVLDGIKTDTHEYLCNGLIRDWVNWQWAGGEKIELLKNILLILSPRDEPMTIGELTRVSINDVRDIPTINMPYGPIPILHASSGVKRILSIAYLLAWSVIENKEAAKLLKKENIGSFIFLADEIEAHLHPKWQRSIAQSLLLFGLQGTTRKEKVFFQTNMQGFMTTHSPLVMTSLESYFQSEDGQQNGAWFDIDLDAKSGKVVMQERDFVSYGSAANWLTSKAFDLKADTSLEREAAQDKVLAFLSRTDQTEADMQAQAQDIGATLSDIDPLWLDLRDFCRAKGWKL